MTPQAAAALHVQFDSQIFCAQAYGGISRYITSLATALDQHSLANVQVLAPHHCNAHLEQAPAHLVRGVRTGAEPTTTGRVASLLGSIWMQHRHPADILHHTYYYPFTLPPARLRTVLTVHDMIHERFPNSFTAKDPIRRWKRRALDRADALVCVSQNTRQDLLEHYPALDPQRVFVTHLGVDRWQPATHCAADGPDMPGAEPAILFVGSRHGYKNFGRLLVAYQSSRWLQENFGLECFGGGPFSAAEQAEIARGLRPEKVRQRGGSDAELMQSYARAALFVYPSLYEGFGLPPLEAMSMDCPVACSQTSSIPEVVGDAGAYFDPSDPASIATTMERLLGSSTERQALVRRGQHRRLQFSWRRCAEETLAIYRATAGGTT
jgi:glycosyltransferase involved in cell wall biosynthesis